MTYNLLKSTIYVNLINASIKYICDIKTRHYLDKYAPYHKHFLISYQRWFHYANLFQKIRNYKYLH